MQHNDLRNRISKLDNYLKSLYEDKVNGIITEEYFIKLTNSYNNDKKIIEDNIKSVESKISYYRNYFNDNIIDRYKSFDNLNKVIVDEFVDKICVGKIANNKRKIEVRWRFLFNQGCVYDIQGVALIRTLAIKPDILLLDEPFSALDYQSRLAVCDDVYRIIKKEKKTIIMITHDIAEAISMAYRIVILTGRPAMVKKIMDVKLTNSSTPINNRKCVEFSKYYESIWKELDFHVQ